MCRSKRVPSVDISIDPAWDAEFPYHKGILIILLLPFCAISQNERKAIKTKKTRENKFFLRMAVSSMPFKTLPGRKLLWLYFKGGAWL